MTPTSSLPADRNCLQVQTDRSIFSAIAGTHDNSPPATLKTAKNLMAVLSRRRAAIRAEPGWLRMNLAPALSFASKIRTLQRCGATSDIRRQWRDREDQQWQPHRTATSIARRFCCPP